MPPAGGILFCLLYFPRMPSWLTRTFVAVTLALYAAIWAGVAVQNGMITGMLRDIDRVEERLTRTHFLLYPLTP